ncbi:hypothetical protein PFICI_08040 [Pestalotiopsis fici W106-1]|uniref:Uncharacterized protein n=1 Tax=Pestalotiopsis fici (strain W106-1 / CGMCC3.15140) TaxID=1229662 RepID=W3X5Q1_PESFW|nr:uncharacterized protein PFICI_08040 [Pestalotiopsis fici W106-1]ETS80511.1 hypothetical protein PFICI_08040 [Pestalotiopsis fici W106-1]
MSTYYELRMLNKMSEYTINKNAQNMLRSHDEWKSGIIDESELGRRVRMSRENRAAVIQTMVKIASIMQKKPEESKYVLNIIEMCGEIVSIADKPLSDGGFPFFMKLPLEVRRRILELCLYSREYYYKARVLTHLHKKTDCSCPKDSRSLILMPHIGALATVSKHFNHEVLQCLYNTSTISFQCACEMGASLRSSAFFRNHVHKILFHWWGPNADKDIKELRNCSVEDLTVVVAKTTMKEPTKREKLIRESFARLVAKASFPEALGFEELSSLRGLKSVHVMLANRRRVTELCSMEDQAGLQRWLKKRIVGNSEGGNSEGDD